MDALDVAHDVLEHRPNVRGADEDRRRVLERAPPSLGELGGPPHRVLQLRPVRLHREAGPGSGADRSAREDVVREDEVGWEQLADSGGVQRHVPVELRSGQLLKLPRLEPLVPVDDEHRQDPADLRPHDLGSGEVEPLRVPLLAEDHDVVAGEAPLARERTRVDVRARALEQVAVPEEDPHLAAAARGPTARADGGDRPRCRSRTCPGRPVGTDPAVRARRVRAGQSGTDPAGGAGRGGAGRRGQTPPPRRATAAAAVRRQLLTTPSLKIDRRAGGGPALRFVR